MISSFGVSPLDCNPFNASFNTVRLYLATLPHPTHAALLPSTGVAPVVSGSCP